MADTDFGTGVVSGAAGRGGLPVDNTRPVADPIGGGVVGQGTQGPEQRRAAESVHGDDLLPGGSNVVGGVTRRQRRVIGARSAARLGAYVNKGYRTSQAVLFNNVEEMFQDTVSRDFAQEIIEDLFSKWGVPVEQAESAKYAEDLLWAFLVTTTASNKADYNKQFEVPVRGGGGAVVADFAVFSELLASVYGVTRRQFARGVADDVKAYILQEDNKFLLPLLATRVACDPQMAHLAFDGSTHCSGMTTREIAFTKTLESRNLFERDDVIAQGAGDRLMQGMSGGVRSVVPR